DYTITAEKYVINYGAEYDNQSGETFRLTTANFYKGLPKRGTVVVGNNLSVIDVDFEWRLGAEATSEFVTYDAATGFDGNVYVVIKNENRVLRDTPVKLTVETAGISGIAALSGGGEYTLDPFGETGKQTIFASGSMVDVIINGLTGTDNTRQVKATYTLPKDFYKDIEFYIANGYMLLDILFTYPGGQNDLTEKLQLGVTVNDRTILNVENPEYRSIIIDPFLVTSFKSLPSTINVMTAGGTVPMFVEWPNDSIITAKGGDYPDNKLKFTYYAKAQDGEYKLVDGKYVPISATEAPTFVGDKYMPITQSLAIPIKVMSRDIKATDVLFKQDTNTLKLASEDKKLRTTVRSYIGQNGKLLDVTFDKATSLPTTFTFNNAYAYEKSDLPNYISFKFGQSLEQKEYFVTFDAVSDKGATKLRVWNKPWVLETEKSAEIMAIDVVVTSRINKVTVYNSDIASEKLSANELRYAFDVYTPFKTSAFKQENYQGKTTYYADGKFVSQADWEKPFGYKSMTYVGTDTPLYKVLGDKNSKEYLYKYDEKARSYEVWTDTMDTATADKYDMVFIYTTSQVLNVDWNHSDLSYTVNGGKRFTSASVSNKTIVGNKTKADIRVPLTINKAVYKVEDLTFESTSVGVDKGFFDITAKKVTNIDPYRVETVFTNFDTGVAITGMQKPFNYFARRLKGADGKYIAGVYEGDRYEKTGVDKAGVAIYTLDPTKLYGTAKKEANGTYTELTPAELGLDYLYFPTLATLPNGEIAKITWDFAAIKLNYKGGDGDVTVSINNGGEYNYHFVISEADKTYGKENVLKPQSITVPYSVVDKKVTGIVKDANYTILSGNTGYAGFGVTTQTYIDPYNY
ncbi:MAG: hypothetical protein RR338_03405, partial [Clostridia bacterium]